MLEEFIKRQQSLEDTNRATSTQLKNAIPKLQMNRLANDDAVAAAIAKEKAAMARTNADNLAAKMRNFVDNNIVNRDQSTSTQLQLGANADRAELTDLSSVHKNLNTAQTMTPNGTTLALLKKYGMNIPGLVRPESMSTVASAAGNILAAGDKTQTTVGEERGGDGKILKAGKQVTRNENADLAMALMKQAGNANKNIPHISQYIGNGNPDRPQPVIPNSVPDAPPPAQATPPAEKQVLPLDAPLPPEYEAEVQQQTKAVQNIKIKVDDQVIRVGDDQTGRFAVRPKYVGGPVMLYDHFTDTWRKLVTVPKKRK